MTTEQKEALQQGYKTGHSHDFRTRCHCILLSSEEWTVSQLVEFFGVTRLSIYNWFNRYEEQGLEGLRIRSGRGRKRKLDIDNAGHVTLVKKSLEKENRSLKQLKAELEAKLDTALGYTTLRDFLKVLATDTADIDTA